MDTNTLGQLIYDVMFVSLLIVVITTGYACRKLVTMMYNRYSIFTRLREEALAISNATANMEKHTAIMKMIETNVSERIITSLEDHMDRFERPIQMTEAVVKKILEDEVYDIVLNLNISSLITDGDLTNIRFYERYALDVAKLATRVYLKKISEE